MKIAFDVGGVISKYPDLFFTLIEALEAGNRAIKARGGEAQVEVYILSDMHPKSKITDMLMQNGFSLHYDRVHSADYQTHGENCKAVLCEQLGIDILVDDFIGYVSTHGKPLVRLLVMPDAERDYYSPEWKTDGSEGSFGRRTPPGSKRPPEDRPGQKTGGP